MRLFRRRRPDASAAGLPKVLILTPVKDAEIDLPVHWYLLYRLSYPHSLISIGYLESDSRDKSYAMLEWKLPALQEDFRRAGLWKRDFGFQVPSTGRRDPVIQVERRRVLAKSRNHLLMHALDDEEWVLWLDADVDEFPPDIIETLLGSGKDIVMPHCRVAPGGMTFDRNAWRDHGRYVIEDLRHEGPLVRLDAVGGTMLLIRADLHRDGLVFPSFLYGNASPLVRPRRPDRDDVDERGEIETEGLGIMAHDMGYECWAMPDVEIVHSPR